MNFRKLVILLSSSLLPGVLWALFVLMDLDIRPEACGGGLFLNVGCAAWIVFLFELMGLVIGSTLAYFVLKRVKVAYPGATVVLGALIGYYILNQNFFYFVGLYHLIVFVFSYAISGFVTNGLKHISSRRKN